MRVNELVEEFESWFSALVRYGMALAESVTFGVGIQLNKSTCSE